MSIRDNLLNKLKLKTETVTIDDVEVIVSEIGAADYIKLWTDPDNHAGGKVDMAKFSPKLVVASIVDESGSRMFADEDSELFAQGAPGPFMILADAARRLNGLSGDTEKNSEPSLTDGSSSVSA